MRDSIQPDVLARTVRQGATVTIPLAQLEQLLALTNGFKVRLTREQTNTILGAAMRLTREYQDKFVEAHTPEERAATLQFLSQTAGEQFSQLVNSMLDDATEVVPNLAPESPT